MPWIDINTFFENFDNQHDKKYPMPKDTTLNSGKRTKEMMEKELEKENKKYNWRE